MAPSGPVCGLSFSVLTRPSSLLAALETWKSERRLKASLLATRRVPGLRPRSPKRRRSLQELSEPSWRSTVSDRSSLFASTHAGLHVLLLLFLLRFCPACDSHRMKPNWSCQPAVVSNCPPRFSADLLEERQHKVSRAVGRQQETNSQPWTRTFNPLTTPHLLSTS